ncbi:MAG: NAD(P)/FAD-dependent oxidoreductase [Candidatus Lambdaproteobacteria bacterium]|nr:NAD(P)/FAD-dependent oxidoreductase [Candidatus Lambdaproteobacteria bacterium]
MQRDADILIAGAGVAGLALALQLGRLGHSVLLLDKVPAPRDKVCGEGLMPLGLNALRRLDIDPDELPGAYFRGLCYDTRRQHALLDFDGGALGRGLRRTVLIDALQQAALATGAVRIAQERVLGPVERGGRIVGLRTAGGVRLGRAVVAADGVNGHLARQAGAALHPTGYRMGVRLHLRGPRAAGMERVCVGLFPPCDIYLTPVGGDTLLATTMTTRAGYREIFPRYEAFLRASPYGHWCAGAVAASPVLGWYHPLFEPRRFHVRGMLLLGDAGGGIDPCLGLGISLALRSAELAVPVLRELLREPARADRHAERFDRGRQALLTHYRLFDRVFRRLAASPLGSALLVWHMRHWPLVANRLLNVIAQQRRWRSLALGDFLQPLGWGVPTSGWRKPLHRGVFRVPARVLRLWSRHD